MPSYLLSEWAAYYKLEPFGEERGDLRSAIIAATVANANRDPKKSKPAKVEDFMPKFEKQETNIEQAIGFAAAMTAALGGEVKNG